jgi:hypothetical protein
MASSHEGIEAAARDADRDAGKARAEQLEHGELDRADRARASRPDCGRKPSSSAAPARTGPWPNRSRCRFPSARSRATRPTWRLHALGKDQRALHRRAVGMKAWPRRPPRTPGNVRRSSARAGCRWRTAMFPVTRYPPGRPRRPCPMRSEARRPAARGNRRLEDLARAVAGRARRRWWTRSTSEPRTRRCWHRPWPVPRCRAGRRPTAGCLVAAERARHENAEQACFVQGIDNLGRQFAIGLDPRGGLRD